MIVAGWEGGVRIELDEAETVDLADFLAQCYEGNEDSVVDRLSAKLDEIVNGDGSGKKE